MPKRSSGCFECMKRKVCCDETEPECNVCLRRGTTCPGYRPYQAFLLPNFEEHRDGPASVKEDYTRSHKNIEPVMEDYYSDESDHVPTVLSQRQQANVSTKRRTGATVRTDPTHVRETALSKSDGKSDSDASSLAGLTGGRAATVAPVPVT